MNKPSVILCTGGIGSGKSYVAKIFSALGIPVYDSDSRMKALYDEDEFLLKEIASLAGDDVIVNGALDRGRLASRIFSDENLRLSVESVAYPALMLDFERWKSSQTSSVVMIESAIMLEKPRFDGLYDKVISIVAPLRLRVLRAARRDGRPFEEVKRRIDNQWSDELRLAKSDFVISTDEGRALLPQVLDIMKNLKN